VAAAGGEAFVVDRVIDHGVFGLAAILHRDADRELREAVDEVGGAVERVDDPEVVLAFRLAFDESAFLALEAVVRVGLAQRIR
jgi:hypothetical protein